MECMDTNKELGKSLIQRKSGHAGGRYFFQFEWIIDSFPDFIKIEDKVFKSPFFSSEKEPSIVWFVVASYDYANINFAVCLQSGVLEDPTFGTYEFEFFNSSGNSLHHYYAAFPGKVSSSSADIKGSHKVDKQVFTVSKNSVKMLDSLTVTVKVSFYGNPPVYQHGLDKITTSMSSFFSNLESLYDNRQLCDFVVQVQNKKFAVHKVVFVANSKVFQAALRSGMRESINNCLVITDFEPDTVEVLIRFMYTRSAPKFESVESAAEVFRIASKHDIDSLKDYTRQYLLSVMNVENALDVLCVDDTQLKSRALDFIRAHPNSLSNSEKCCELLKSKPHLVADLLILKTTRRN